MSLAIEVVLLVTTVVNLGLALLVCSAYHRRIVHFWFALLTAAVSVWAFAIYRFLGSGADVVDGMTWVRVYYVAAAIIIYALLEFSLYFPRRIPVRTSLHVGLFVVLVTVIAMTLWDRGFIGQVVFTGGEHSVVDLYQPFYILYVMYYVLMMIAVAICFGYGIYENRHRQTQRFGRWLTILIVSIAISLLFGAWFNLFLPLFGNYEYIWAGPPFALVFGVAMLFAIVKQGILDIRQAFARTMVYVFLLVSLVGVYSAIAFAVSTFFVSTSQTASQTFIQLGIAIILAFTVRPLKLFFDKVTNELFYRDEYSAVTVLDRLRDVTINKVRVSDLAGSSLDIIHDAFHPKFASLYVQQGEQLHYYGGQYQKPTPTQQNFHTMFIAKLPTNYRYIVDYSTVDTLASDDLGHLFHKGQLGLAIQLLAGKQRVALLMIGAKESGKKYDTKDQELVESIAGELSLAIQNSLRFQEIEQLNATLQQRIDEATKELRASNAQLQHLDATKDEFISMASHQLRTPLTSVKGYISMVIEGDAGKINGAQQQLLGEAFTSSERMVHLINDFLNVSRLQTGKFMLDRRSIDLAKIVDQELDSLRTTIQSHSLKVRYKKPSNFPLLYIDEGKIRQVIMNFVDNAIYYSREDSTINVALETQGGDVLFTVKDKGIGVPLSEQKHLFGKFFRATNARTQRPDGTGVGLFLAKKVIVAHGGSMVFESVEGQGSTFGFRLPIKKLSQPPLENTN